MKTTVLHTITVDDNTETFAKTGPAEYTLVKLRRLDFNATDGEQFDIMFVTDTAEVYDTLYRKEDGEFTPITGEFLPSYIVLKNPLYKDDRSYSLTWNSDKHKFQFPIYPINLKECSSTAEIDSFSVKVENNELYVDIPSDYMLNDDEIFRSLHSHCTEIRNGVEIYHGSAYDKVRLSEDEVNWLNERLKSLEDFCKENRIKIAYDIECGDLLAGHYDELSYDSFEQGDLHYPSCYLKKFNSCIGYCGEDYDFVLKGTKADKEDA